MPRINRDWKILHPKPKPKAYASAISALLGRWNKLAKLLAERGILDKLAFKGGTCLRKMYIGSQGRFSTDLDFTGIGEHDLEDVILKMMQAFDQPFHGIQFSIQDESYYETQDLSLIHISEPTRQAEISYAVFCL